MDSRMANKILCGDLWFGNKSKYPAKLPVLGYYYSWNTRVAIMTPILLFGQAFPRRPISRPKIKGNPTMAIYNTGGEESAYLVHFGIKILLTLVHV